MVVTMDVVTTTPTTVALGAEPGSDDAPVTACIVRCWRRFNVAVRSQALMVLWVGAVTAIFFRHLLHVQIRREALLLTPNTRDIANDALSSLAA
ncbi:hypothetical protein MTO96_007733 [Rhipicephalus appendiculatus]